MIALLTNIVFVGILSCLLISSIVVIYFWKYLPKACQYFGLFVIVNLFVEGIGKWLAVNGVNNLFLLHLYTLLEFMLLSAFFLTLIQRPVGFAKIGKWITVAGVIGILLNSAFIQPLTSFNSYAYTGANLILIGYSILLFFNIFQNPQNYPQSRTLIITINSAFLIYTSGSILIFFSGSFLQYMDFASQNWIWLFNSFLNFGYQMAIIIALLTFVLKKKRFS